MAVNQDYTIKDSGNRREWSTGAVRDMSSKKGRFDLLPWATMRGLAIHYQKGCEKYGDRNWEKGLSVWAFYDSAIRHLGQVMDGCIDENHAMSGLWNAACGYQTLLWIQEGVLPQSLYDLPRRITVPDPYGRYGMNATPEEIREAISKTVIHGYDKQTSTPTQAVTQ